MGQRITRKQLKQDEFVSTMDTVIHWFGGNWRPVIGGLGVVCAAVLLWWIGTSWSSARADKASFLLYQAMMAYEEELAGTEPAVEGDDAVSKLQKVIASYGSSDQADVARVYLARMKMDDGDLESARDLLVDIADRRSNDAVGRVATLDLVHLRVASGQGSEVAQELEAMVAGVDRRLPRDVALYELGELYLRDKNYDQARQYFQRLVDEIPESPYMGRARRRISELG
jgi:predicted negative regulator of RcsB-dependent stress response